MSRAWIDLQGRYYKAEKPKSTSDAELPIINADFLNALPDDGAVIQPSEMSDRIAAAQRATASAANAIADAATEETLPPLTTKVLAK